MQLPLLLLISAVGAFAAIIESNEELSLIEAAAALNIDESNVSKLSSYSAKMATRSNVASLDLALQAAETKWGEEFVRTNKVLASARSEMMGMTDTGPEASATAASLMKELVLLLMDNAGEFYETQTVMTGEAKETIIADFKEAHELFKSALEESASTEGYVIRGALVAVVGVVVAAVVVL